MNIKNHIYEFLNHMEMVNGCSEHTIRNYLIDLKNFFLFSKDKNVDGDLIRSYVIHLQDRGLSKKSLSRHLSALRSFFKFLLKSNKITENPFSSISNPKLNKNLPNTISYREVMEIFNQVDTSTFLGFRDRCILELFYSSAIRVGELVNLNKSSINFQSRSLRVIGKGGKERIVPITKNVSSLIKRYLDHDTRYNANSHYAQKDGDAIFLNRWGYRLSTRSVDRMFKKYLIKSGLAINVTPHVIRHTIATHWLENGMNLKIIQSILGHSSLSTTTLYTRVSMKLKRDVYEKTHPRAKFKK